MDARVIGTTMPVLEVALAPGDAIIAESGELSWMSAAVSMRTSGAQLGGSGVGGFFRRRMGGGTFWLTEYRATTEPGLVAFAARMPGQIFAVDVKPGPGNGYLGHRHSFLCATEEIDLSFGFQRRLGAGLFAGTGFRLQKITGTGRAWVELSGEVVCYDLRAGEEIRVHPGHVGLLEDCVDFSIARIPGIRNKLFGRDGLFLAKLTGPGRVWLQSLPIARLAQSLLEYLELEAGATGAVAGAAAAQAGNPFVRTLLGRP